MVLINRKDIEDYYEKEWSNIVSPKTLELLIELTCRSYQLHSPPTPSFIKQDKQQKSSDLGKI